jgi:hypothetical protein
MSRRILFSVVVTDVALAGRGILWSALVGWHSYVLMQGTTPVAGGAIAAWMLYIQHQYEATYYKTAGDWSFELAAQQHRRAALEAVGRGARLPRTLPGSPCRSLLGSGTRGRHPAVPHDARRAMTR